MEFRVYAVSGSAAAPEDRLKPELHTIQISPSSHAINPLSPISDLLNSALKLPTPKAIS
jgi:hypothetical protein